jgi:uncharacterized membrane protein YccC
VRLQLRRPDRAACELALRAAISVAVALWFCTAIGLEDPYWGAISAVVATAGTLGASLGAAFQRVVATIIALAIGLGFAALPWNGVIVSAIAVGVTYVVMLSLSLAAGARLAAASTLIVTAIPGSDALDLAFSRGLNVPIGCLVAVVVGLVVFPHRATTALRVGLCSDAEQGARLAADGVRAYLGRPPAHGDGPVVAEALGVRCARLKSSVASHRAVLLDAAREPGSAHHLVVLDSQLDAVEALVGEAGALVELAAAATGDLAPTLVGDELGRVAAAIDGAAPVVGSHDAAPAERLAELSGALAGLDLAFAEVRRRLGTVDHSTDELARLLSVMRRVHGVATAITLSSSHVVS